ncbi:TonB-dependent receptor [Roseateles saccharophilus]|uniref:Iron complex outermembrane receptor protein n=2 Tax=Roseateles saccharophilus TaxID=304 RepID=A0A4V2VQP1_ROSSA|nr:TonB-dependent receptor [Roseateles saccharophilus]TCU95389.1 iron complex outermembrane receptor protein [Roseateles saccharophilus]
MKADMHPRLTTPLALLPLSRGLALAGLALSLGAHAADEAKPAADVVTLEPVSVSAQSGAYRKEKNTASAVAPTQASLTATQPQSVITREFIEQSVAPTAEYSRIVAIAPSVSGDSANGPGLSETKTTLRGFGDDQYNITFDGIPWGDTNNPAHHSTSFFPGAVIGGAVVERGPGNASNLGFATFGGSLNLFSKQAGKEAGGSLFTSFGRWNTRLLGVALESGELARFHKATVQLNVQRLESDGYLTKNSIASNNVTLKVDMPLSSQHTLTGFMSVNRIHYVQPDNNKGPTLAQVAQYGKNYSLNDDPTSFNYTGFNHTGKATDFEYLRLRSRWSASFSTEAQVYTYSYDNQTISSTDPTGATAPGTKAGPKGNTDIPGIDKQNKYRVMGGIFRVENQFEAGTLRAGVWTESSDTDRHQYDLDLTLGVRDPRETKPAPVQYPSVLFDQQSRISSFQPYAEFEWEPLAGTSITPGIKYVDMTRSVSALVNQTTRLPQNASVSYGKTLPFLTLNQRFGHDLAAYAQYAKGFQIPDLKSFYIADPTKNSADPQTSTNYQLGIVGKNPALTWDADIYRIDFKNKYVSNGLGGTAAAYVNVGGAVYKGVEGQATWMVGGGFAAYANASVNKAIAQDTGKTISGAPNMTAALGALYNQGPWGASLIWKRTGSSYQQDYDASNPGAYERYRTAATTNTDLSLSYRFTNVGFGAQALKLQLNVFNLMNKQDVTSISPAKNPTFDQYTFQAPRSYQVSAKAEF